MDEPWPRLRMLGAHAPPLLLLLTVFISVRACVDDSSCLQARPSWSSYYTCSNSASYCTGSWQHDMDACCPVTCGTCNTRRRAPGNSAATRRRSSFSGSYYSGYDDGLDTTMILLIVFGAVTFVGLIAWSIYRRFQANKAHQANIQQSATITPVQVVTPVQNTAAVPIAQQPMIPQQLPYQIPPQPLPTMNPPAPEQGTGAVIQKVDHQPTAAKSFCIHCGAQSIGAGDLFCPNCGQKQPLPAA